MISSQVGSRLNSASITRALSYSRQIGNSPPGQQRVVGDASNCHFAKLRLASLVISNDGNTLLKPWSPHMGICASSACDTRSTPAPVRLTTTDLVLFHLCSFGLLWSPPQHSRKSLTGPLFQVSDVFSIMLGSRSSPALTAASCRSSCP